MNHSVAAIIHSLKLNSDVYLVINLCLHSVTNEVKMSPVLNICVQLWSWVPKVLHACPKQKLSNKGYISLYGIGCMSKTLQSVNIYKADLGDAYFDSERMWRNVNWNSHAYNMVMVSFICKLIVGRGTYKHNDTKNISNLQFFIEGHYPLYSILQYVNNKLIKTWPSKQ